MGGRLDAPIMALNFSTSRAKDPRRYSSSSTVPFLPPSRLRSFLRLFLDVEELFLP